MIHTNDHTQVVLLGTLLLPLMYAEAKPIPLSMDALAALLAGLNSGLKYTLLTLLVALLCSAANTVCVYMLVCVYLSVCARYVLLTSALFSLCFFGSDLLC